MNNSRTHSAVQPNVPLPPWGDQSSDRLSYDGVGRMISKRYLTGGINGATHAYNNTTALVGATTGYDRAGNKLYERHLESESRSHLYQPFNSDGSFAVGYDSANRLLQYQRGVLSSTIIPYLVAPGASILTPTTLPGTDQVRTYGLDGLGNWKNTNFSQVGSGGAVTTTAEMRQHNYVNEITQRRDTTGSTVTTAPFAYDYGNNTNHAQGNGNLVNDGVRTYLYDAFNRLIQVGDVSTGAVISTYVYDAFNRRTQKTINYLGGGDGGLTGDIPAGVTDYLYDGLQIVEERNDAFPTVWTKINFWGQYIDELMFFAVPTESAPTTYRVLSDLLYRSVAIVTTDNVITEAYDTDAYGNTLCYSGPGTDGLWFTDDDVRTNNPINTTIFTGRQYDPESQIYYYRARYYAPQWGRFISRDPIGIRGGINLYAYVLNNPTKWVDPFGLICLGTQQGPFDPSLEDEESEEPDDSDTEDFQYDPTPSEPFSPSQQDEESEEPDTSDQEFQYDPTQSPSAAYQLYVRQTAYSQTEHRADTNTIYGRTSTGTPLNWAGDGISSPGIAAVDIRIIPYGSTITTSSGRQYMAVDTGGSVKSQAANYNGSQGGVIDFYNNGSGNVPQSDYGTVTVTPYSGSTPYINLSINQKSSYFQ